MSESVSPRQHGFSTCPGLGQYCFRTGLMLGFSAMLVLVAFVTYIGLRSLETIQQHTEVVVDNHIAKIALATSMSRLARQRTLVMQKMTQLDDPFERDELSLYLDTLAAGFANARMALMELPLTDIEESILAEQGKRTSVALPIQREIIDLLATDNFEPAQTLLVDKAIPAQEHVLETLEELYVYQKQAANQAAVDGNAIYSSTRIVMLWLSAGAILLGFIIATIVIRKTVKSRMERDRHIAEMEQMNITLQEQSRKLKEATAQAQQANYFKSAFLANMSHEIRTPLTAIIGFSEILQDESAPFSDREYASESIARNGKHLVQIINDVLDISKIEAGKLDVECISVNLLELIDEVASATSLLASNKGIDFQVLYDFPLPEMILTDPVRLRQILINLINNAIKFTDYGSVSVRVGTSLDHEHITFTISDTGIGMTEDQLGKVFNDFSQADLSTTRRFGGTGLGLSISKHLAKKLNGELSVSSVRGKGSRFVLEMKLDMPDGSRLLNNKHGCNPNENKTSDECDTCTLSLRGRILLAEDNPDNQRLISLYIRELGAEVMIAGNGKQAVEMALADDFDVVLMDMQMPEMDGVDATRTLRSKYYAGPIIALTANAMQQDIDRCMKAGCNGFLSKPIDRQKFCNELEKYLTNVETPASTPAEQRNKTGLSQEQFEHLVALFLKRLPEWITTSRTAAAERDWTTLGGQLHDLKGLGAAFGYPELTRRSMEAHTLLKAMKTEEALSKFNALVSSLEDILSRHEQQQHIDPADPLIASNG